MMKSIPNYWYCAALLFCGVLFGGCSKHMDQEPSGRTVRIGVIAPLTGPQAEIGKSGLLGVEIAQIVMPLLSNGDALEFVVEDNKSLPEETQAAMARLAAKDVVAVLLLSPSNQALALTDETAAYGIPIIATVATHPDITKVNQHMVQLCFDDVFQGSVAAMYLRDELFLQRAVVISDPRDPHSSRLASTFIKKFTAAGGEMVDQETVHMLGTNVQHRLRMFEEQSAEILYLPLRAGQVLDIARSVRRSSWNPIMMVGDGLLAEILLEYPQDLRTVDGVLATDVHGHAEPVSAIGREIYKVYKDQVGATDTKGSSFTVLASEGVQVLHAAMGAAGPPYDASVMLREISQIRGLEGYAGFISIGQDRKAIRPVFVNTLSKGKHTFIVKVY